MLNIPQIGIKVKKFLKTFYKKANKRTKTPTFWKKEIWMRLIKLILLKLCNKKIQPFIYSVYLKCLTIDQVFVVKKNLNLEKCREHCLFWHKISCILLSFARGLEIFLQLACKISGCVVLKCLVSCQTLRRSVGF